MSITIIDAMTLAFGLFVSYIVTDSIREYRDERAVDRFHVELNDTDGYPAGWRLR